MYSGTETTSTNRTLQRTLASLAHPITIGAIILLLVNDHVLRILWPSWLTGKLGDVAWLAFAPIVLAALLAPFLPRRGDAAVGIATASVGLVFALGNTVPAFLALTLRALEWLFGVPVRLQLDPTDLLTLPALALAWLVWKRPVPFQQKQRRWGWAWLLAGAFATLANSGPWLPAGVYCIEEAENGIIDAITYTSVYLSEDGGLTWYLDESDTPEPLIHDTSCVGGLTWVMSINDDDSLQYRFTRAESIERSEDGGRTWQEEITFGNIEARRMYYVRHGPDDELTSTPGPLDAFYDESSGNVIVAMGQDGVLTRTRDGAWHWVSVGPYHREEFNRLGPILELLVGEVFIGLMMGVSIAGGSVIFRKPRTLYLSLLSILVIVVIEGLLLYNMFALNNFFGNFLDLILPAILAVFPFVMGAVTARIAHEQRPWPVIFLISALAFLAITTSTAPATEWSLNPLSMIIPCPIALIAAGGTLLAIITTVESVEDHIQQLLIPVLPITLLTPVLFILPFVAWVKELIPDYYMSALIGWIAALGILILGATYLRRHYPVQEQAEDEA